jgi:hypothetical protein
MSGFILAVVASAAVIVLAPRIALVAVILAIVSIGGMIIFVTVQDWSEARSTSPVTSVGGNDQPYRPDRLDTTKPLDDPCTPRSRQLGFCR